MNDQLAIQYALFRGLQSCALFNDLNVVLGRDYIASKIAQDAVWQTPAPSGRQGTGAIIQIPQLLFPKPNSLQREREYSIGIYEQPDFNFSAGVGTFRTADDWADSMIDFLWNWRLWRTSGLVPQDRAVVPDTRWAADGIVGVRAVCVLRQERAQPARCSKPVIAVDGRRLVTLTVTDGSDIYFTTDGFSLPSPRTDGSLRGEQAASQYNSPFPVNAGTIVMAAAWPGFNSTAQLPSHTADQIVN